jgi:rhamnose transport system permease protein
MGELRHKYGWELFIFGLLVLAVVWSSLLSPYYLNAFQLFYSSKNFVFTGIIALGLMFVILVGEMDLSGPSILAVATVTLAEFSQAGMPLAVALPVVLGIGSVLGLINGYFVAYLRLPSLAVTLGTMSAYRGLAFIIGSEVGYTGFNSAYLWLGGTTIGGGLVPTMLPFFGIVLVGAAILAHYTTYGRRCYAVGSNSDAVRYSGDSVVRVKMTAYVLSGLSASIAAIVFIGQYGSARGDNANGVILGVITSVVLGGVDINGGKGKVGGVLLSILFLWTLRNGMGLANIAGPIQQLVIGTLLVVSIMLSNLSDLGLFRFLNDRRTMSLASRKNFLKGVSRDE